MFYQESGRVLVTTLKFVAELLCCSVLSFRFIDRMSFRVRSFKYVLGKQLEDLQAIVTQAGFYLQGVKKNT